MSLRTVFLAAFLAAVVIPKSHAERNTLKPLDLKPLTSLPWKDPDSTLEKVLDAIFREPNPKIRYPVLAEYLRSMPVEMLGNAFEICIRLEGKQTPDELVDLFLPIWAERDPETCWKRTSQLFKVVGIESDWLDFDSWKNEPIVVNDPKAIHSSLFWLSKSPLRRFPLGVEESSLPIEKRVELMKAFSDQWFRDFKSWPGYSCADGREPAYPDHDPEMIAMFDRSPGEWDERLKNDLSPDDTMALEIAMRRWLAAEPASAPKIVAKAQEPKFKELLTRSGDQVEVPSMELLLIWAKVDLTGMVKWVEAPELQTNNLALKAKGILMSHVDQATRSKWLVGAKPSDSEEDPMFVLLSKWAEWDPKPALEVAVSTNRSEIIEDVAHSVAYGPAHNNIWNLSHHGLGVFKEFDFLNLPAKLREELLPEWGIAAMEQWGDIDIGEAARYGLEFMLRNNYTPRENLIKLFSGDDKFASDSDLIDRTFCALRVWAVIRPHEMESWIATLPDAEMRKALTWLLQNPWGTGAKQ